MKRALSLTLVLALIAGCATVPPPPPAPPPPPPRDRVAELRTAALASPSAVEIAPLQNPSVDYLLGEIAKAESTNDTKSVEQYLEQALQIEPENPRLWQLKAEALLRAERYLDAEKLAMKSYELGSRIGQWCMRNWLTIAESRDALGDANTSVAARERASRCPVKPLPRY